MTPRQSAFAVAAAVILLYLVFPTRDLYWDGIAYALDLQKGYPLATLFHPNHLIHTPLMAIWWHALGAVGYDVRSIYALQGLNCLLSGIIAGLCCYSLERWTGSRALAVATTLTLAVSATWWRFSTDSDPYILATLLLLLAFLALESDHIVLAACLHAGAMAEHQLSLFFYPAAIAMLWPRRGPLARYLALSLALIAGAYGAVYQWGNALHHDRPFVQWLLSHSPDQPVPFSLWRDITLTLQSHLKLLIGGKWTAAMFTPFTIVAAVLGFALPAALWRAHPAPHMTPSRRVLLGLVFWVGAYLPFLFFWRPQDAFHRLFYVPAAALLIGLAFARWQIRPRYLALTAAVLFAINFIFYTYPGAQVANKPTLSFALARQRSWPPGTRVVYRDFYPDLWTISYFNEQASWLGLETPDIAALDRYAEDAHKYRVPMYLEGNAYDLLKESEAGRAWLAQHTVAAEITTEKGHTFRYYRMNT